MIHPLKEMLIQQLKVSDDDIMLVKEVKTAIAKDLDARFGNKLFVCRLNNYIQIIKNLPNKGFLLELSVPNKHAAVLFEVQNVVYKLFSYSRYTDQFLKESSCLDPCHILMKVRS